MDNDTLTTKQLSNMKEELRLFSSLPTSKIYKIMSTIYKANISEQQLIDSQITKSFARIALKNLHEYEDDEKKQKSIKIAKKLLKKWRDMLDDQQQPKQLTEERPLEKRIKSNITEKRVRPEVPQVAVKYTNGPSQEHRDKAVEGIQRYITKYKSDAPSELAKELEIKVFQKNEHDQDHYKNDIKSLVKKIDQLQDFRNTIYAPNSNIEELII